MPVEIFDIPRTGKRNRSGLSFGNTTALFAIQTNLLKNFRPYKNELEQTFFTLLRRRSEWSASLCLQKALVWYCGASASQLLTQIQRYLIGRQNIPLYDWFTLFF